ncbi:hypothetical protein HZC08_00320 [Candidatus Micrarchaeota archaeon]|nr:hypothetical protein [Candidatus Micrarchaeota archaeon]
MVFGFKFGEQKKDDPPVQETSAEFKSNSVQDFLKTQEIKKMVKDFSENKKAFTKRGITKLIQHLWPSFSSDRKLTKAVSEILKALRGEDGLQGMLSALKLIPEGIMKGLK